MFAILVLGADSQLSTSLQHLLLFHLALVALAVESQAANDSFS